VFFWFWRGVLLQAERYGVRLLAVNDVLRPPTAV